MTVLQNAIDRKGIKDRIGAVVLFGHKTSEEGAEVKFWHADHSKLSPEFECDGCRHEASMEAVGCSRDYTGSVFVKTEEGIVAIKPIEVSYIRPYKLDGVDGCLVAMRDTGSFHGQCDMAALHACIGMDWGRQ